MTTNTPHTLSFPLPRSTTARIYLHLTVQSHHILLFLTTSSSSPTANSPPSASLGSFVYALPSRAGLEPLSTPLYIREDTIETATRIAKILVRRCGRPVYVGSSMNFASAGMGGTVEEQMEGVRKVIETVAQKVKELEIAETGVGVSKLEISS